MTYEDAMAELVVKTTDAYLAAMVAFEAADNEDGMPAQDVKRIQQKLATLVLDVQCLADHRCTREQMRDAEALYKGAKLAGLTG